MTKSCVLVVDDEIVGREMLAENLEFDGYEVVQAESGEMAWRIINDSPDRFDAVLLDRMMPDMDGIEILRRLKARGDMQHVPVIMQTGMTAHDEVLEGLRAGAYYYLTKPFAPDTLLAIVDAATRDHRSHRDLVAEATRQGAGLACLREARFVFRTLNEARNVAMVAANAAPDPARVVLGLSELMVNAIEHGNLGIGYAEKSRLIDEGELFSEVDRMLSLPEHAGKFAELHLVRLDDVLEYRVCDQGPGFNWQKYLEMSPGRAFDTHGRGIAMSRLLSFDRLEYQGCGNQAVGSIFLG